MTIEIDKEMLEEWQMLVTSKVNLDNVLKGLLKVRFNTFLKDGEVYDYKG